MMLVGYNKEQHVIFNQFQTYDNIAKKGFAGSLKQCMGDVGFLPGLLKCYGRGKALPRFLYTGVPLWDLEPHPLKF